MAVVLQAKHASEWSYRGEGALNLVLSYCGSSPEFIGKALRVPKALRKRSDYANGHSVLTVHERHLWKEIPDLVSAPAKEIAEQIFVKNVICPLLGHEHVDPGVHISVSREFLEAVEKNVDSQRPPWRVDAAKVDPLSTSLLLMSDHSVFPSASIREKFCISVEIKPKCGYLPYSEFIAEENSIKKSIVRFRMHQALKLRQGKIFQISEYSPLDLFSGSKERVRKAMKDLFVTPQNNFRVFLNGSLIFGGLGGGAEPPNLTAGDAFEDVLKHIIRAGDGMRTQYFLELVAEAVSTPGLLDRILEVQKLDNTDIEGAIHAYYDVISQPCEACRDIGNSKSSERYSRLHKIPKAESLEVIKNYLISATAKDLSVMISFRPRENGDLESPYRVLFLKETNQSFDYKAAFIDLDMKPLKKMEYYYKLDKQIISNYIQVVEAENRLASAVSVKENLLSDEFSPALDHSHSEYASEMGFQTNGDIDKSSLSLSLLQGK